MLRGTLRRLTLVVLVGTSAGCAGGTAAMSADDGAPKPAVRRDRFQITFEELQEVATLNLYDAVQRIHPEWLTARNQAAGRNGSTASGQSGVQVYMDTQRLGNVEMLRQLTVSAAASLKFYSAPDAQSRFGIGNSGGAIQIIPAKSKP